MKKIVTFGEIMLRLSPPAYRRLAFSESFEACYAGGEANVATSLSNYGMDAYFVSKVPKHEIGDSAIRVLRSTGVHTQYVVRGGDRLGVYYLEHGASVRPSKVVYDRAHSAIAEATEDDFDFDKIMRGADWFHVSGITPALSASSAILTKKALEAAKKAGVITSFDLNYRKKLWKPEKAQAVCIPLMEHVDVCIGNEEDAEKVLGFKPRGIDVEHGKLDIEAYKVTFRELQEKFDFRYIATTLRESISASDNGWSALLYDAKDFYASKRYNLHLVDRVGGGDSFSGGLIYAFLENMPLQKAVDFAVAASALKQTIHGDFNQASVAEVETLAAGDGSGRVVR